MFPTPIDVLLEEPRLLPIGAAGFTKALEDPEKIQSVDTIAIEMLLMKIIMVAVVDSVQFWLFSDS